MIDKEYKLKSMKKVLLILLSTLLFISCERISIAKPIATETRVYELTDVDCKTKTYTFYNVDVNASEGISHSYRGYYFYLTYPSKTYGYIEDIIRYKRIK